MQALFYIVIFGVIYALIGFVTFGATETTAELTQRNMNSVKQMFADVEYAVNENHLRENVDIVDLLDDDGLLDLTTIAPYVSWSPKDLTISPWRTKNRICQREVLAPSRTQAFDTSTAFSPSQRSTLLHVDEFGFVAANVYEFILVSTGPNRVFDSSAICTFTGDNLVGTFTDLPTVIEEIGKNSSDDIIHVFSTRKALERIASAYVAAEQKIVEVIYNGYAKQFVSVSAASQVAGYKDYTDKENTINVTPSPTSYVNAAINSANYTGCYNQFKATYCADASSNWSSLTRATSNGYENLCSVADANTELSLSSALMFCYLSDKTISSLNAPSTVVHADFVSGGADVPKPDIRGFEATKNVILRNNYDFEVEEICSNPFSSSLNKCSADSFNFVDLEVVSPSYLSGLGHPNQGEAALDKLHPMFRTVMTFTGGGAQDWQIYREIYIDALNAIE